MIFYDTKKQSVAESSWEIQRKMPTKQLKSNLNDFLQ